MLTERSVVKLNITVTIKDQPNDQIISHIHHDIKHNKNSFGNIKD